MMDDVDRIMAVMETAFDPAYGEAWSRRQVADALLLPNTHYLLAGIDGNAPGHNEQAAGFALSRGAADEEELLLLGVSPEHRRCRIGTKLLERLFSAARVRGATKLFLEMREGNPAELLYNRHGFRPIGRRPSYYSSRSGERIDAITFVRIV